MRPLALTFDDGPDASGTVDVLDALAAARARATFFVIGPRAQAHPDLVARVLRDGHEVGLHCDAHVRHTERSRAEVQRDTEQALARLRGLGVTPSRWRVPWGVQAPWTPAVADEFGLRLVGWDVDSHDWRGDAADVMFDAIAEDLRPGAVVLCHDGLGPGARRVHCADTARLVTRIAGWASERGLSLGAAT